MPESVMGQAMETWLSKECLGIANHIRNKTDIGIPFALDKLAKAVRLLEDNPYLHVYISPTPEIHKEPDDKLSKEFIDTWIYGARYQLEDNLITLQQMEKEYQELYYPLYGNTINIHRITESTQRAIDALRDLDILKAYGILIDGEDAIDLTTYEAIASCQYGKKEG